ncbi:MAG: helix-turn-helix transcriptional regulator [Bacteroidales bacterium]|jgi:transcriptional regulator with XRE-family HTH domain|nr:helix-turn-helix transcriptional regulator [Bacteroidales bacterium]
MENIYKNIVKIRKKLGYSQEYMSEEMNIDVSNYSKLERGITSLSIDKLAKIANIFDIDIVNLIKYPKVYVEKDTKKPSNKVESIKQIKTVLTIEFEGEDKEALIDFLHGRKMNVSE